ncbi:SdpI family protein [Paenibacillus ottowii]|uniref:SdpI family protein n=1 Tax=Paenibacillus ottowii TaxID=2315729 RepID=UPI00272FC9D7|nr:SdpI family protein [Paenibacillus ottowii]MDP1512681.1 SdpI family protein [Paenibacillus ottowii]
MEESKNNYDVKEEFKKPWMHVSIFFIVLHVINFSLFSSSFHSASDRIALLYFPLVTMVLTLVIVVLNPRYSKHRDTFTERMLASYRKICASVFIVLDLIFLALMFKYSGGILFSTLKLALFLSATLHLAIGISFATITPNRLIGLKFPWLLSNERAWKKTHRISAHIWIAFGLIGIAIGLGQEVNAYMVLASFLPTLISFIISLLLSQGSKNIDC